MTMQITSAYNFVPLSRHVVQPDWQDLVSHDLPLQEGLCAELEIELEAHTPLLVGGERAGTGPSHPVEFCRDAHGMPVVPGSSLRGLLRNVLEIATFARLAPVMDDRALSLRDLNLPAYRNHFTRRRGGAFEVASRGGWLRFDAESRQWAIHECAVLRIFHEDLKVRPGGPDTPSLHDRFVQLHRAAGKDEQRMAQLKYEAAGGKVAFFYKGDAAPTEYQHSRGNVLVYRRAWLCNQDAMTGQGYLVLTGQPGKLEGPRDTHQPGTKHIEFLFDAQVSARNEVSPAVMQQFHEVYAESSDLGYLSSSKSPHAARGIPVFFLQDRSGAVSSLGLSQMYRLPGPRSLGRIAADQQNATSDDRLDFVQTLLGHVIDGRPALKGRVAMGDLRWLPENGQTTAPLADAQFARQTVLAAPKPSFHPNYLEQSESRKTGADPRQHPYRSILDDKAALRGWKRYPVRDLAEVALVQPPTQGAASNSVLRPLAPGVRFRGTLRLHNVRPEELGALVWALDFGDTGGGHRHALGMGKPFGFGQVSLRLLGAQVRCNDPRAEPPSTAAACAAFEAFMERMLPSGWTQSPQLQELKAMARPDHPGARRALLKPLQLDVGRANEFVQAKKEGAVLPPFSRTAR